MTSNKELKQQLENNPIEFTKYFFKVLYGYEYNVDIEVKELFKYYMETYHYYNNRAVITSKPRVGLTDSIVFFIAWCLMKNPEANFIYVTYNEQLSKSQTSKIKNIIDSDEFKEMWPDIEIDNKVKGNQLKIKDGGGVLGSTSTMGICGFGAGHMKDGNHKDGKFYGGIFIDSPMKPQKFEKYSAIKHFEEVKENFENTIKNRANNVLNTPIIIAYSKVYDIPNLGDYVLDECDSQYNHLNLNNIRVNAN